MTSRASFSAVSFTRVLQLSTCTPTVTILNFLQVALKEKKINLCVLIEKPMDSNTRPVSVQEQQKKESHSSLKLPATRQKTNNTAES